MARRRAQQRAWQTSVVLYLFYKVAVVAVMIVFLTSFIFHSKICMKNYSIKNIDNRKIDNYLLLTPDLLIDFY